MYHITCSSCAATEKSPFARVGAVMVCPSCKAKVQLRVEDVKRQYKLRLDGDDDLFKVQQVVHAEEMLVTPESALVVPPVAASATTSTTAIHEDHAELADAANQRAESAKRRKPKAQSIGAPGITGAELAQHLAQKRKMKSLVMFGSIGAAALVLIVIVIASAGGGNSTTRDGGTGTQDGGIAITDGVKDSSSKDGNLPATDGNKDKSLVSKDGNPITPVDPNKDKAVVIPPKPVMVRVPALPLGIDSWQPVNDSYRVGPVPVGVAVINDTRQSLTDGGQIFTAQVMSQRVASALVTVDLVNDEDRVYARFERPYFLIDPKQPRPIHLSIPPSMVAGSTTISWQVQPIDTHVTNLTLLEDTLAELVAGGQALPIVKISAYNSSSASLKDSAFVIQGFDANGNVASQWRLKYPNEIDARSWVKFEAELPATDLAKYASWRVLGAGLPGAAAPVVPDPVKPAPVVPDPGERNPDEPQPRRGRGLFDF